MSEQPAAFRTQPDSSAVVATTREGGVRILSIERRDRMNSLDPAAAAALRQSLQEATADRSLRVIVLHGAGGHFCTGFDLKHKRIPGEEGVLAILQDCFRLLQGTDLPSIAAVEGNAFGAGLSLALACDQIVAAEHARLCAPFTAIGLVPDVGMVHTLERRVGFGRARRYMYEGTVLTAQPALAVGLVDEVVAPGTALDASVAQATGWCARAPLALAAIRSLSRSPDSAVDELLAQERRLQASLAASGDFAEGVAAFRERRKPVFRGL